MSWSAPVDTTVDAAATGTVLCGAVVGSVGSGVGLVCHSVLSHQVGDHFVVSHSSHDCRWAQSWIVTWPP